MSEDHDLLIRIDERTQKLAQCMTNHLAHHWAMTVGAWVAAASAIALLIVTWAMGGT